MGQLGLGLKMQDCKTKWLRESDDDLARPGGKSPQDDDSDDESSESCGPSHESGAARCRCRFCLRSATTFFWRATYRLANDSRRPGIVGRMEKLGRG